MNKSDFDLTVGPEGILHQDLWFDAQLHGAQQEVLQSESFDRITKRLVLPARQSMSQVVRLDSIQLSSLLLQAPQKVFQLSAMVMTNPVTVQGQISTGSGGYKVAMPSSRMMERQGTNLTTEAARQKLTNIMLNGTPSDKVQAVELVATYFHYNDIRARWPKRLGQVQFASIHPDPSLAAQVRALVPTETRTTVILCEREADKARNIAADLAAVLPSPTFDIRTLVSSNPTTALHVAGKTQPVLFAPRVWGALGPVERADPRALEVRYLFDSAELTAAGERFHWQAR